MSKKTFTEKQIKELYANPFVKTVSAKGVTYTNEFKRLFIAEREKGKFSRQIFQENGFDPEVLGATRMKAASKRWQKATEKKELLD